MLQNLPPCPNQQSYTTFSPCISIGIKTLHCRGNLVYMRSPCTSCSLRNRWALFLPSGAHLPRTSGSPLFNVLSKTGQRRRQRAEQVLGLVQIKSRCTSIPKLGSIFLNLDQGSHEGVDQATKSTFRRPCRCLCPSYSPCHSPCYFSCHWKILVCVSVLSIVYLIPCSGWTRFGLLVVSINNVVKYILFASPHKIKVIKSGHVQPTEQRHALPIVTK